MAKLKEAAKRQQRGYWDASIKESLLQVPPKPLPLRLWEEVKEVRSHWVDFVSETKGKTGFGELCLNWDPVNEKTLDGGCPLCEKGNKVTSYYYAFAINRKAQAKGGGMITVHPIRLTGKLAGKIGNLSEIAYPELGEDAPDATDIKKGFDVLVSQTNTNGKIEYEAHAGDKKALTKDEIEAFEEYVAEHDIGKMAKSGMQSRATIIDNLAKRNVPGFGNGSSQQKDKPASSAKKRSYEDYDSPADDEDAAVPPSRKAKPEAEKRQSLTGDDDEDETPRKSRRTALDDDEEDAAPVRRYATPSADDTPDDEE